MAYTGGPNATRLLRNFTALYPVTSRPVLNDADTVSVTFGVSLVQIRELVSFVRSLTLLSVVSHVYASLFRQKQAVKNKQTRKKQAKINT